jgi:hypothetical protein
MSTPERPTSPTIGRLARLMRGESPDPLEALHGVWHQTVVGWQPSLPNIVGHYLIDADGTITEAAAECPDCIARVAAAGRQMGLPADDLPF